MDEPRYVGLGSTGRRHHRRCRQLRAPVRTPVVGGVVDVTGVGGVDGVGPGGGGVTRGGELVQLLQTLLALLFVRHVHVWILQQRTEKMKTHL
jgi:hypothetical protein